MSETIELKCWPGPFEAVVNGCKRYEVRSTKDRQFRLDDVLILRRYVPCEECDGKGVIVCDRCSMSQSCRECRGAGGKYTGNSVRVKVTYITPGGTFGLPGDLCVMSIEVLPWSAEPLAPYDEP